MMGSGNKKLTAKRAKRKSAKIIFN